MNIVLVGYRGCGKTTVGRLLARHQEWPFVDTDALIQERTGKTLREIIAEGGEHGFRELEGGIVAEVAAADRQVISTGGGVLLREENARALKANGKLVWLTAPPEVLWERIVADMSRRSDRPPLNLATGLEDFRQGFEQRLPTYERWADVVIDTTHRSPETVVQRILARLQLAR